MRISLDNGTAETTEEKNRWKKDKSKNGYEGENEKGNQKHYWKSASKSGIFLKEIRGVFYVVALAEPKTV